jgi:hypothetical protein
LPLVLHLTQGGKVSKFEKCSNGLAASSVPEINVDLEVVHADHVHGVFAETKSSL